jgi:hypothetical protein
MNLVLRFFLALIIAVSFIAFIACSTAPGTSSSSSTASSSLPPGTAVGWIGGTKNGWQQGSAPAQASDYQSFNNPFGVFVDSSGYIYVADYGNNRVCKWSSNGQAIGWIGGTNNGWQKGSAPAYASDYKSFNNPFGVFVDSSGNIYVADTYNNRVCKWNSSGVAQGWIGGTNNGWQQGNAPAFASDYQSFYGPSGIYVDSSGNIYVADGDNNRISKWNTNGTAIGWIGGTNNGWQQGNAPAFASDYQSFFSPTGIYVDSSGNIYVADFNNSRISKWNTNGTAIGWIGGTNNGWQKGGAPSYAFDYKSFYNPTGVFVDSSGNIYVADEFNNRISKWSSSGVAQGWIGGANSGWQQGNAPAQASDYRSFYFPYGIYVDSSGYIYVADRDNNRISKWH